MTPIRFAHVLLLCGLSAATSLTAATLGPCDTQSTSHNICIDDRNGSVSMVWSGLLNLNIEGFGSVGGNGSISGLPEQFQFWAGSTGAQDANFHTDSVGLLESSDSPSGGPFSDLLLSDWQVISGTGDTLYHGWFQSSTTGLLSGTPARSFVESAPSSSSSPALSSEAIARMISTSLLMRR